jgi:hypothetical protein
MTDLRDAARQALETLEYLDVTAENRVDDRIPDAAIKALRAALAEEALQRLTDVHQEIEAVLEQEPVAWRFKRLVNQDFETDWVLTKYEPPNGVNVVAIEPLFTHPPRREQPKFTLSCGCPSQYGGVPAYWDRDGSTAFGMICEKHWHEYGARSEA